MIRVCCKIWFVKCLSEVTKKKFLQIINKIKSILIRNKHNSLRMDIFDLFPIKQYIWDVILLHCCCFLFYVILPSQLLIYIFAKILHCVIGFLLTLILFRLSKQIHSFNVKVMANEFSFIDWDDDYGKEWNKISWDVANPSIFFNSNAYESMKVDGIALGVLIKRREGKRIGRRMKWL